MFSDHHHYDLTGILSVQVEVQYDLVIRGGYVPKQPANIEKPRILDVVKKTSIYTVQNASKTLSRDTLNQ